MYKVSICLMNFLLLMMFSIIIFIMSLYFLSLDIVYFIEWELISMQSCSILMTFLFDWMSLLFMSFVLLISSLVIYYSMEYMSEDINMNRFIFLVIMFVFSMMMLIISPNLISILLGWDGLGLVSYCLVIYFQNVKSYNAGMLTALSNRVGDVAILIAIAWMLNYGSWNYIFYIELMKQDLSMNMIGVLVVLAAITKSAQIPFSSWLPAAMAAPTPVSALVHSSTLVTAGVYLLIRFNVLFVESMVSKVLLLIGGLTMFMAGMSANFEYDLKKIIALSTLSQLGLMMSILAMGYPKLAFFHLLTHALFKALLFMCAGVIIHNMKNSQDIRDMGSLVFFMPLTVSFLNIANLSLCGLPFLAGFYSKDLILEMVMMDSVNMFTFILFIFSTGLTVCYSFRLSFYSLVSNFSMSALNCLNDESWEMSKSMVFLFIMAIIGGSMLSWVIFISIPMICLPIYMKNLILIVCMLGGSAGYLMSKMNLYYLNKSLKYYFFSFFNGSMMFMPFLSTLGIVIYPFLMGKYTMKSLDQGWSEYLGGQSAYLMMKYFSMLNQFFQNNNLKVYLMMFIFWVMILVFMVLMK